MYRLKNKKTIVILVVILLVIGLAAAYYFTNHDKNTSGKGSGQPTTNIGGINYGPPTEQDKAEADQRKQTLQNQSGSTATQSSGNATSVTTQAAVTITFVNYSNSAVQAAGFVGNVFEDGGNCTLTISKGSSKVSATSTGFKDVNKTTCPPITINRSQIPQGGDWSAILSYNSSKASGSSTPKTISVP